jgi:hypothetical protein
MGLSVSGQGEVIGAPDLATVRLGLEAVRDTVEEKAIVALKPKPAFQALFQIATTREGSSLVLIKEILPELQGKPDESASCSWWRRGRVDLHRDTYLGVLVAANRLRVAD